MRLKLLTLSAFMLLVSGNTSLVQAASIVNGDFTQVTSIYSATETFGPSQYAYANPAVPADSGLRLDPFGHTGVNGWYFNYGAGIAAPGTGGFGVNGAILGGGSITGNAAFLQGDTATISQLLSNAISGTVTVSFYLEGRSNYDQPNNPIDVTLGNQTQVLTAFAGPFVQETLVFTGVTQGSTLSFAGLNQPLGGDNTSFIADVSATAVPLPKAAGVGFCTLGVFGALAVLRKRLGRAPRIA